MIEALQTRDMEDRLKDANLEGANGMTKHE